MRKLYFTHEILTDVHCLLKHTQWPSILCSTIVIRLNIVRAIALVLINMKYLTILFK